MQPYLEHPSEEALERFLLHQSQEPELETVEAHILACESCVGKLEILETQIVALKIAVEQLEREAQERESRQRSRPWKSWLGIGGLSFAGAAACVALALGLFMPAQVTLSAYRGAETTFAPEWRPLDVHLNVPDLADGSLAVQLVNNQGAEIWRGKGTVSNEHVDVQVPRITRTGNYFLRLYEPAANGAPGDLLREFAFQVR